MPWNPLGWVVFQHGFGGDQQGAASTWTCIWIPKYRYIYRQVDGWMDTNSPSKSWFPLGPGEVWLPEIPRIAQLRTASAGAGTAGTAGSAGSGAASGGGDEARRQFWR